jgi:hypothetical protein
VDTLVSASYLLATMACVVGKCLHQALFLALDAIEERCVEERQQTADEPTTLVSLLVRTYLKSSREQSSINGAA